VQRVVESDGSAFAPLDDIIHDKLLPALSGQLSGLATELRSLVALPVRNGGMGMPEPSKTSTSWYADSQAVIRPFVQWLSCLATPLASSSDGTGLRAGLPSVPADQPGLPSAAEEAHGDDGVEETNGASSEDARDQPHDNDAGVEEASGVSPDGTSIDYVEETGADSSVGSGLGAGALSAEGSQLPGLDLKGVASQESPPG